MTGAVKLRCSVATDCGGRLWTVNALVRGRTTPLKHGPFSGFVRRASLSALVPAKQVDDNELVDCHANAGCHFRGIGHSTPFQDSRLPDLPR